MRRHWLGKRFSERQNFFETPSAFTRPCHSRARRATGRDNAMLSAMLLGATREKALTFLQGIKEFSELGDSFEEPEKTYSAGMRLRLGFTTALMTQVDILLIDEVLSVANTLHDEPHQ
jgi:ABC-type polysaccharide/polyol phosphate transport system ATPase subunit